MTLTIGISPCPNDTFIFDAIYNHRLNTDGLQFEFKLMDVEQLNKEAARGSFDVTKLSYYAYTQLTNVYQMLRSGGALGHNCGPLLVAAMPGFVPGPQSRIAIPGWHTTAHFLLTKAYPFLNNKKEVLFSEIEEGVLSGEFDAGLIIHESRFTYRDKGLFLVRDLGEFWEEETHTPIPLGGIVVKRSFPEEVKTAVNRLVAESVQYAFNHPEISLPFIMNHAQEMKKEVVDAHI
jgi:1,4-dihydroxy-6-naphthoate synthase